MKKNIEVPDYLNSGKAKAVGKGCVKLLSLVSPSIVSYKVAERSFDDDQRLQESRTVLKRLVLDLVDSVANRRTAVTVVTTAANEVVINWAHKENPTLIASLEQLRCIAWPLVAYYLIDLGIFKLWKSRFEKRRS